MSPHKKIALTLIVAGLALCLIGSYVFENTKKFGQLVFVLSILSLSIAFFGAAMLFMKEPEPRRSRFRYSYLTIALLLIAWGAISKYFFWPGSNIELIVGVFCYCFSYAPMELQHKYQKWKTYSANHLETMALSSLDFLGVNLILLGLLTKRLHWPGQYDLAIAGGGILLAGLFLWNSRFKKEVRKRKAAEEIIQEQYTRIIQEQERSESLLLNILPVEIANELKEKGTANAKDYDTATILFTDFKDFTGITAHMRGQELVAELNICYQAFDAICEQFRVEKIKTIGDSYMAVGGLSGTAGESTKNTVLAALAMQDFILRRQQDNAKTLLYEMRAGIHTGPVVAGIVGVKKFQYDIWGDTVNIASRMESSGAVGRVNISRTTFELLENEPEFRFENRGSIAVKGKGNIEMWFVERRNN